MRKVFTLALAALAMVACAQNNKTQMANKKALVVFFSHAGDNYAVGIIKVGNTKIVADFDQYEVIFIGGPVWWGTYPQVMFTFFDTYDLNGKTIYPFTTHEGSGLGSCVQDVKKNYPRADVQKGFSMYGHDVRTGKAEVEKWINGLNL